MKLINIPIFIALLFLVGCAGVNEPMKPLDFYSAPNFDDLKPEHLTVLMFKLNQDLDITDSAFYPDFGIGASTTWPAYLVKKGEKNMKNAIRHLAIKQIRKNGERVLCIYIPKKQEEIKDYYVFVTDHLCKRVYGPDARFSYLPEWDSFNPQNFPDVIKQVSEVTQYYAQKGTADYDFFLSTLEPFKKMSEDKWMQASKFRDDYLRAYNLPLGTKLSEEQIKFVLNIKGFSEKLISFLGEDWYAVITYPIMTAGEYGASVLITKVMQIPTKFWKFDYDRPGYMDRTLTAQQGGAMIRYYDENYGFKRYVSPELLEFMQALYDKVK